MAENTNISKFVPCFENENNSFEIKASGVTYEVTTHFNKNGTQTVLQQFMELLRSENII